MAPGQECEHRPPHRRGLCLMNDTIKPPTILLTAAQATVRWLAAQRVVVDGAQVPYFAGAWAIFGHGNVAGLGEALHAARSEERRVGRGCGGTGRFRGSPVQ